MFPPDDVTGGGSASEPESTETHTTKEDKDEPRKYAEKFDSVEDLEKAYGEAQGKMTQASQKAAEAEKLNEQWQQFYANQGDERAEVSKTTEPADDDGEYVNRKTVQQEAATIAGQMLALDRGANANIRAEIGKRRSDKLFGEVADEYEAALMRLDPNIMVNPQSASEAAEYLYNAKVGEFARKMASGSDPVQRKAALGKLGFEPPAREETSPGVDTVQSDGKAMLSELGLSKDGRKKAIERFEKAQEEA